MVSYFMKRYAMSEKGAINLKKAIISHTFVNLTKLFAPMIAFMFLFQYIGVLKGIESYNFTLFHYLILIIVMMILMFLVARWDYVRLYTNVYNESANSRIDLAERLKKLPLSYFGKRDLADLAETMMNDMNLYETIFSHAVPHIYSTAISTGVIALMLIIYNPKLAFAALWVIPISLLIIFLSRKSQKKVVQNWIDDNRKVFDDLQEKIEQIEQIKSYNLEEQMLKDFFKKLNMSTKQKTKGEIVAGTLTGIATAILKLGIISVAVVGVNMLIAGEINILVYIAFLMMTTSIYLPIEGIITFMSMIVMLDAVVGRIKEIKTMPIQEGKKNMEITNYDIEFKDVYFGYDNYSVINGVSFIAKQGEITALIGSSGSGKTTVAKLAARFWDIDRGKILIGGKDISEVDPETLLKNFSIVFQDVILFNTSIKDNIKIGKKDATDEEITRAAKIARCDDFINKMPNGIDTIIGENGQRLSGGERQRISIARAILKDAPIILLDEATASLDVENESLIQEALSELIKEKTVIVIAHRLRTIRNADKIVLLNAGKIEAVGTDSELCKSSEFYKAMLEKANIQ
ncbi:ABC transporter ATP-binding protein [Parvimonas micra]|uniref:ABC transporter ATP-binding protein/permease n=1 Tax=Parvimonas micra TaxID=33033 RepID=A0A9X3HBA5_9FIRM|nr:ABC transporter ATP-binding protein [Parvimonas micra]MCZ7408141.1 ABC transporter ATP-binding protein/permease [Parvimonas micra]MCZ7411165.1 ABC transporter ATP-binding protein/permease [Parvimonas micra]MCZ7411932.1 ABC transporter ATP-binding protein/permease [Parvimonas micra]WBB37014.1 ABC transporter ATP-binding protein/permease [Parvimonas micra]